MFLNSLCIDNYRSLFNFQIFWQPYTVVIGRNDAGKSNVLRAVQLLLDDSATQLVDRYDWCRTAKATRFPREITITGSLDGQSPMVLRRRIELYKNASALSVLEIQDGNNWRSLNPKEQAEIPIIYYLRPRTGALQESFDPANENNVFSLIKEWMPPAINKEADLDRLMRHYAPRGTTLGAYCEFFQKEINGSLRMAFEPDFPLLYLNPDYRSPDDRGQLIVRELTHSEAKEAQFRLPLDHHGTGLISVVAIVLSISVLSTYHQLELNNRPLILAIEEPEVHLHPNAQRTLSNYFKWMSKKHQIILTTHSPVFIDRAQPKNVILFRRVSLGIEKKTNGSKRAGTTEVIYSSYKDNWNEIVDTLGLRLSDVLMSGEINLVVEGPTEAILLPAMYAVLHSEEKVLFSYDRLYVIQGRGGNTHNVVAALTGNHNPILIMVDGDQGGDNILKNLAKNINPEDFDTFILPSPGLLPPPCNMLKEYEFEDLLDSKNLLEAFNEAFADIPGFEFLPITYQEYSQEQIMRLGQHQEFGWVHTIGSIIGKKTKSADLKKKSIGERFSKVRLAETSAVYIRQGKLPVPEFVNDLFAKISRLMGV